MQDKRAGFVGLGLMGLPMAKNALTKGWHITAWNRSPGPLRELQRLGGEAAALIADMRDLPVIIFVLPDLPEIEEAAAGLLESWERHPPAPGTVVVVMSSVSPTGVQDFGHRVAAVSSGHARVVDAPVSGGTRGAADGTLAIMAGAEEAAVRSVEPLLHCGGGNDDGGTRRSRRARRAVRARSLRFSRADWPAAGCWTSWARGW